jgi:LacI family transcriptional regulator
MPSARRKTDRKRTETARRSALRTFKIGLLLSEATGYGRGVLQGIAGYAEDHPEWKFRVESPDRAGIDLLRAWQPDGLVVMLNQKSLAPMLRDFPGPVVTVCNLSGLPGAHLVQSDDVAVGRLGAEHLLETGAELYGFIGLTEGTYAGVRSAAFHDAIKAAGQRCVVFTPLGVEAGTKERVALRKWLLRCAKPMAIMASNDACGRLVLETCRDAGLRVPNEVSVLGVDNEDPLSRLVWPGLSSISLATDQIGHRAANQLHRLLAGLPPPKTALFVPPLGVVARRSTRQLPVKDPVLSKVLTVIHRSVATSFSVEDLLKHVHVSRVSLERRFRQHLDRTPLQEIRQARIARARQLLIATNLPLKAIAERCGFAAASRLIEAFERETGCSPTRYRERVRHQRQER